MKTIAVLVQKGGAGKSTISAHMGVAAGDHAMLADLDPQRSLAKWHRRRQLEHPYLAEATVSNFGDLWHDAKDAGAEFLIVDTPPHTNMAVKTVLEHVDFCLIPIQPSMVDLDGVDATAELIHENHLPHLAVLNRCKPRRNGVENRDTKETRDYVSQVFRLNVWDGQVTGLDAFSHSWIDGRAAEEYEPNGKAAQEMRNLWRDVLDMLKETDQ